MSYDPTIMATLELLAARWPAAFAIHKPAAGRSRSAFTTTFSRRSTGQYRPPN